MNKPHIYAAQFAAIQKTRAALNALEAGVGDEYFRNINKAMYLPWRLGSAFEWPDEDFMKWHDLNDNLMGIGHYNQFKDLPEIGIKP